MFEGETFDIVNEDGRYVVVRRFADNGQNIIVYRPKNPSEEMQVAAFEDVKKTVEKMLDDEKFGSKIMEHPCKIMDYPAQEEYKGSRIEKETTIQGKGENEGFLKRIVSMSRENGRNPSYFTKLEMWTDTETGGAMFSFIANIESDYYREDALRILKNLMLDLLKIREDSKI